MTKFFRGMYYISVMLFAAFAAFAGSDIWTVTKNSYQKNRADAINTFWDQVDSAINHDPSTPLGKAGALAVKNSTPSNTRVPDHVPESMLDTYFYNTIESKVPSSEYIADVTTYNEFSLVPGKTYTFEPLYSDSIWFWIAGALLVLQWYWLKIYTEPHTDS